MTDANLTIAAYLITARLNTTRFLVAQLSTAIYDLSHALADDVFGDGEDVYGEHLQDAQDYLTDVLDSLERAAKQAAI